MDHTPSFDDLGVWDDLDEIMIVEGDEKHDPRTIDPRALPPDVVEIDRTLADLEAELVSLRLKRAHILASQNLIGRMPPEILSHIFELGVYDDLQLLSVISLVSRQWRSLALSTPSLWTYIILDHEWGIERTALFRFMHRMRMCLERSQTCKLLVDLDIGYVVSEELRDILVELQPHLARCFSFRMSTPSWDMLPPLREHLAGLGQSLEELHLRLNTTDIQNSTPYCTLLPQACPRLKAVVLEHLPLLCVRADLPALSQLHIRRDHRNRRSITHRFGIAFKELLAAVVSTPALQELRLHAIAFLIDGNEDIFERSPALTTIPSLRTLCFDLVDSPNLSLFLENTSLPSLTRLSVDMESTAEENMHWLSRMSLDASTRLPSLRQLDLRACTIYGAALVPFVRALHHLPQLTALSLSSPRLGFLGAQFFDLLAAGPATVGAWILPRLQALCVQLCVDVTGHELLRVVCARRGASAPDVADLRYLKISQCDSFDMDVLDQLRPIVEVVRVL